MKALLITHGQALDPTRIAAGNSVRAHFLERGLTEAGIEVVHLYPEPLGPVGDPAPWTGLRVRTYADREALAALIRDESPDALILGYWELVEELPDDLDLPIVLDLVAPRILEAMYQTQLDLPTEVRRTLACYRRADRFLAGNARQAHLLLSWLILAGFDCRERPPIQILPIVVDAGDRPRPEPDTPPDTRRRALRLVSGGVSWPWRRTEDWFDRLVTRLARHGEGRASLTLFSGGYVYAPDQPAQALSEREAAWPTWLVQRRGLLPYGEMQAYLAGHCDIGVELADENTERRYSQSFRAMEFLRNGLPLICNGYTELAEQVRDYDAGWVVDDIGALDAVVEEILGSPALVARKSAQARRLVRERFHYAEAVRPLAHFLRAPMRTRPGPALVDLRDPMHQRGVQAADALAGPTSEPAFEPTSEPTSEPTTEPQPQAPAAPPTGARPPLATRLRRSLTGLARGAARAPAIKRAAMGTTRLLGGLLWRINGSDALILISRGDIRPATHGAAVKIDRTAWGLSHRVSAVYLVSEDRTRYHAVRKGVFSEHRFPAWLARLGPDPQRVRDALLAAGVPGDDAFLYRAQLDWSFLLRTLYLALKTGARRYQAEFPAYARAAVWTRDLLGGRALLVEHNVEHQRLAEQCPRLSPEAHAWLKAVEVGWCNRSDAVIVVSEADRQRLARDGVDPSRLHRIPHGVDLEQFDRATPRDLRQELGLPDDRALLVYHGIYLYPPNLEAMEVMGREILPRLERLGVKASVLAIGSHPPARSPHPAIHFTGALADLAPAIKGADLAVVPLLKGGGTRMKILDYFAAGLAVVSTAKGAEGIPIEPGVQAWVGDDLDAFAEAVAGLLGDPEARRRMGTAGRAFVADLDWRAIAARYLELV